MNLTREELKALREGMTQGKWNLKLDDRRLMNPSEETWYLSANGIGIAVQATFSEPSRAEANARAIAKLPDVLDGLIAALKENERLRSLLDAVVQADTDSIRDAGTPDNHYTEHVCIGCGTSYGVHDEDCFMPVIRQALKENDNEQD